MWNLNLALFECVDASLPNFTSSIFVLKWWVTGSAASRALGPPFAPAPTASHNPATARVPASASAAIRFQARPVVLLIPSPPVIGTRRQSPPLPVLVK